MSYHRSIRASLALVGVALVLIFTAGAASAEETGASQSGDQPAASAATSDPGNGAVLATSDSTDPGDSHVGDALLIERPAPSRNPTSEVVNPVAAPVDAPAPASAAPVAVAPASAPVAVAAAPAPSASVGGGTTARTSSARPTQVLGVQITRSSGDPAAPALARTGAGTSVLVLVAGVLLALGMVLIRMSERTPARR